MSEQRQKSRFRDKFLAPVRHLKSRVHKSIIPSFSSPKSLPGSPSSDTVHPSQSPASCSIVTDKAKLSSDTASSTTHSPQPTREAVRSRSALSHARTDPPTVQSTAWNVNGWGLLKGALTIVEALSRTFPPLHAAIGGLVVVVEYIDKVEGVDAEFSSIAQKIRGLESILGLYQDNESQLPIAINLRLQGIAHVINVQRCFIEDKLERGTLRRALEVPADVRDVVRAFRTISDLVEIFMIDTALNTDMNVARTLQLTTKLAETSHSTNVSTMLEKLRHVPNAAFNAGDRNGCMPGTRVAILHALLAWATDPGGPPVYWLSGMAGTGKTAIAYSLSTLLQENGMLRASFFCSRSAKVVDVRRIFPTIAWAMARTSPRFCDAVVQALERDPDAESRSLSEQFEALILKPAKSATRVSPLAGVIVLDALDECDNSGATKKLVEIILNHASSLHVKIFMSSRPEPQIRNSLLRSDYQLRSLLQLHDVDEEVVQADIKLYLTAKLDEIAKSRTELEESWPPQAQVENLVKQAGRLFIYAFTAYKYISEPIADPEARLLNLTNSMVFSKLSTAQLDIMYRLILEQAFTHLDVEEASNTKQILAAIISIRKPLSVQDLGALLDVSSKAVRIALISVHSLIQVPSEDDTGCVSTFHASFSDYITNPERSGRECWFVDLSGINYNLAGQCLDIMTVHLHFNITKVCTSYLSNHDSRQSFQKPAGHISYACQFWMEHLIYTSSSQKLLSKVESLLRQKFLFWLEVLSVDGMISTVSRVLRKLRKHIQTFETLSSSSLIQVLKEASEFIIAFQEPIMHSAPHIYLSALPFAQQKGNVWEAFQQQFSLLPIVKTSKTEERQYPILVMDEYKNLVKSDNYSPAEEHIVSDAWNDANRTWDADTGEAVLKPLKGHRNGVTSIAFSPDNKYIVSGSDDYTIKVWNVETGEALSKSFEGHENGITSVAFSSDGTYIVSGSEDCKIRMWNARTGEAILKPFEGHTSTVTSVAISPDGKSIVSGSWDCTIRFWSAKTGEAVLKPLTGHTDSVTSVAFSPDGKCIISGSYDNTIRIWDISTGQLMLKPSEGHTNGVTCVSCSFNGKYIVSGSEDYTIRVWNAKTGEPGLKPFEGHTNSVTSVAFSPDDKYIVSGSWDHTIRVWDVQMGESVLVPLEGHRKGVTSVVFSPDGRHIISGSEDYTIRVWNAKTGEIVLKPLESHTHSITSAAFSSDGKLIASGSHDNTVRIWNAETGEAVCEPLKGHTHWVRSVVFSPDGKYIVSGSWDGTVRVWNADTGKAVMKPLEGHTSWVRSVAFSPNGKNIVSGSNDNTIRVWSAETGQSVLKPLEGHTHSVTSVAFSPDSNYIVSGSWDLTVRVWNVATGNQMLKPFEGHTHWITCVVFSPDGKHIVSSSHDSTIRIWNAETGEAILKPIIGHTNWVRSVAFSPDGKNIVSGSWDHTIRIWNAKTGKLVLKPLEGHTDCVTSAVFSSDGKYLLSSSKDHTIRVWNMETREAEFTSLESFNNIATSAAFSSDGTHIVSGCEDTIRISLERDDIQSSSSDLIHLCFESDGAVNLLSFCHWQDGWIVGPKNELLIWVPSHLRTGLWWPHTHLIIGSPATRLELSKFVHGSSWMKCHT